MTPFAAPLSEILQLAVQVSARKKAIYNAANDTGSIGPAHLKAALIYAQPARG